MIKPENSAKVLTMTNTPAEEALDVPATAKYLGRPESTIRYWRHLGIGPKSFKFGRRVFYRRSDIDAWVAAQYQNAIGDNVPEAS